MRMRNERFLFRSTWRLGVCGGQRSAMSERQLSKRSQRQLRLRVAQRLAGSAVPTKKPRIEPATSTNHREDGDDAESSDQEAYREVEVTADSSGEGEGGESCGNVEDVEGSDDDNPSESYIAGEDREGVSDGELSALVTASEDDFSEGSSDEDMTSVSERGSIATGTQSEGTPLFQESAVKSEDFNTAFLSLVQRHNLTYSSQGDILKLLSIVLPSPSNIPSSAHVLYKKFTNYKDDTVVQHFCDNCTCLLEPGSSCKQQKCAKASCGVFVRIPLSMQLKERFDGMFMHFCVYIGTCICKLLLLF